MVSDNEEEMTPRRGPPARQPAPKHPSQAVTSRELVHAVRLDREFLNPDRTLHFAHQVPSPSVPPRDILSTQRFEHEIKRIKELAPSLDSVELDSVERRSIMKHAPRPSKNEGRYDTSLLPDVEAPTPVKPRKVKKQVSEKWKQAHAVAPSFELNPLVDHGRETCIRTPLELTDDPSLFQWHPPSPVNSDNPPRYLNDNVLYFN
ncbi:hypothetical protein AC1031_021282 [Aphanomyces cochlioides]|nr:hypothetical protein AC1031_021282 [Aphanomyces cochlioides]